MFILLYTNGLALGRRVHFIREKLKSGAFSLRKQVVYVESDIENLKKELWVGGRILPGDLIPIRVSRWLETGRYAISVVSKMLKRNRNRVETWEETTSNNHMLGIIYGLV